MSSPFTPPPAGTPVPPNTSARYYSRQQIFSRVPITGNQFQAGKQCSFVVESTGGRYLNLAASRIVAKLKVTNTANDGKLEKSVRFATDPVTNMFSAGMFSINGTTISSTASNLADISMLQLRTEHTRAGADAGGSAGLLSFNQKMTQEDRTSALIDGTAGGTDSTKVDAGAADTLAALPQVYHTTDERSDKHELLVNNFSGHAIANHGVAAVPLEVSTPLGQMFPVARTEYFIPNVQARIDLTISDSYAADMFYTQQLRGEAGAAALTLADGPLHTTAGAPHQIGGNVLVPGYVAPVAAAAGAPTVVVEELFLDAMFAIPSVPIPAPRSFQIPFQDISVYTRSLASGSTFTEQFTGLPGSLGACVIGLRSTDNTIGQNRELYELGGGAKGFKTFSFSLGGQLLLPQPAYQMDMQKKQVGRAFADWLDFIGGNMANGVGGEGASLTSWTKSPLLAIRVLQDPGAYSSTATLRFELKDELIADDHAELVVWVIHQRVMEAFFENGETFPSRILVDDVLN
jgi:hypothetical protein